MVPSAPRRAQATARVTLHLRRVPRARGVGAWSHALARQPLKLPHAPPLARRRSPEPLQPDNLCLRVSCLSAAPSQPPGNIVWNSSDSKIVLNWDRVTALGNESEVKGYKVGGFSCCSGR